MEYQEIVEKLGALKDAATVERVFGEAKTLGDRMVIPVAEVRTGMGFGFGAGKKKAGEQAEGGEKPQGEGGGGGGGVMSRPVGVVEVTPQGTTFIPIKTPMAPMVCLFMGMAFGMMMCMMKDKWKCGGESNNGG